MTAFAGLALSLDDVPARRSTNARREVTLSAPTDSTSDEGLLLHYARAGDRTALDALVKRHWASAFRLSRRVLGDAAAAEDAAQEAFIALVRGAARFDEGRPFGPWFRTLVMNATRMSSRSRRRRRRHEDNVAKARVGATAPPVAEKGLLLAEVEEHLGKLPFDVRFPMVLHFYEGCSYEEVAAVVGCQKSTAHSRIHRGLEQLRESLAGVGCVVVLPRLESLLATTGSTNPSVPTPLAPSVAAIEAAAKKALLGTLALKVATAVLALGLVAGAGLHALRNGPGPPAPQVAGPVAKGQGAGAGGGNAQQGPGGPQAPKDAPNADAAGDATGENAPAQRRGPGFLVTVWDSQGHAVPDLPVLARACPDDRSLDTIPPALRDVPLTNMLVPKKSDLLGKTDKSGQVYLGPIGAGGRRVVLARRGLDGVASTPTEVPEKGVREIALKLKKPGEPTAGRGDVIAKVVGFAGPLANKTFEAFLSVGETPAEDTAAAAPNSSVGIRVVVETDAQGRFVLRSLRPETYQLMVKGSDNECARASFVVEAGEVVASTIAFDPTAIATAIALVGRVLRADGKSLDKAAVELLHERMHQATPADSDGRYRFTELPTGRHLLRALAPGFGVSEAAIVLDDTKGTVTGPDFVLGRGGTLRGRIVGEDSRPQPDVAVALIDQGREPVGYARTDENGRFQVLGVPEGTVSVSASRWSDHGEEISRMAQVFFGETFSSAQVLRTGVEVSSEELDLGDLVLKATASLSGTVFGPDGRGTANASVFLVSKADVCTTQSNSEGRFQFQDVAPGHYELVGRNGDLVSVQGQPADVRINESNEVNVTLAFGGSVTGTVSGPEETLTVLRVFAHSAPSGDLPLDRLDPRGAWVGADGRYRITGMLPGRYRIEIPGVCGGQEVVVIAGHEETVNFTLATGGGRISVRLTGGVAKEHTFTTMAYTGSFRTDLFAIHPLSQAQGLGQETTLENVPAGTVGVVVRLVTDVGVSSPTSIMLLKEGIVVTNNTTLELEFPCPDPEKTGTLEGRVGTRSKPGDHFALVAFGEGVVVFGQSRADGSFTLPGVPAGTYCVTATRRMGGAREVELKWENAQAVTIEAGKSKSTGPLVLSTP